MLQWWGGERWTPTNAMQCSTESEWNGTGPPEPEGHKQESKDGGVTQNGTQSSAGGGFGGRRHARKESLSVINLLPQEVRALTDFLREKDHLATHGLFVNSAEQAFAAATEGPRGSRVPAPVRTIREALDRGLPVISLPPPPCLARPVSLQVCCVCEASDGCTRDPCVRAKERRRKRSKAGRDSLLGRCWQGQRGCNCMQAEEDHLVT